MTWFSKSSRPIANRFRHEGESQGGLIIKQDPMMGGAMPAPSAGPPQMDMGGMGASPMDGGGMGMPLPKSALGMRIDEIDTAIQALGSMMDSTNDLLSQARAMNIDPQMTMAAQKDLETARQKVLSLTMDISMVREIHASLTQHGPPAEMPMGDPMAASMGPQAPMNMPPGGQAAGPSMGPGM